MEIRAAHYPICAKFGLLGTGTLKPPSLKERATGAKKMDARGTYQHKHLGHITKRRKQMEKEGNKKPSAYKFFYRTKGSLGQR
ncbi:unnamed protein product [Amaranthus hypochondriacus]